MLEAPSVQHIEEEGSASLPKFDLDSFKDKGYLTHSLHPYPAKYIPQIPALIIEKLSSTGDRVLDPFCGSGTTLVEAVLRGRHGYGVDSNDLAVKIARAKSCRLGDDLENSLKSFHARLGQAQRGSTSTFCDDLPSPVIPDFKNREHWFTEDASTDLGLIRALINEESVPDTRNIIEVVFSSIIVKCSRQDSDTRWRAVDRHYSPGTAITLMAGKLEAAIQAMKDLCKEREGDSEAHVFLSDARKMDPVDRRSMDLIVTSPPYLNSFDYYLYHKLRTFWLDIDHRPIQEREIGSRNKHCDLNEGVDTFVNSMLACSREFARVLKPKGLACLVVGDSIYKGELIPMDDVYNRIMGDSGFVLRDHFSYDQRKYTRAFTPKLKTAFKRSHVLLYQLQG